MSKGLRRRQPRGGSVRVGARGLAVAHWLDLGPFGPRSGLAGPARGLCQWHPSDIAATLAWSVASLDSALARPCGLEEAESVMPPLVGDLVRPR
jgi:hypothetical protein